MNIQGHIGKILTTILVIFLFLSGQPELAFLSIIFSVILYVVFTFAGDRRITITIPIRRRKKVDEFDEDV